MNGSVSIRTDFRASDPEAVSDIVRSTNFFREDEVRVAIELADDRLAKGQASDYNFIFAESGDKTVAYACWGIISCSLISYDLYWIATHAEYQNKGIGGLLLRETEKMVKQLGGNALYIETSSKPMYKPTVDFYTRNGYEIIARLKDFYELGDDKYIFSRVL